MLSLTIIRLIHKRCKNLRYCIHEIEFLHIIYQLPPDLAGRQFTLLDQHIRVMLIITNRIDLK